MSRRTAIVGMAIVLAVGVGLRCFRLSERSVWFDEASAVTLITRFGWAEMIERCARNVHPPLYYIVLRSWAALFGHSVVSLRSFSVVLAAVTILGVYVFARDAYRLGREGDESVARTARGIGLTGAALLAVSSSQIVWAQQIRMYALGTALAAFSSWALVRALRSRDFARRWWAAYSLLAAGLMYTHNYGLFTVCAQGLFFVGFIWCQCRASQRPLLSWAALRLGVAAFAVALLVYSPWIPVLIGQTQQVHDDYWISPLGVWTLPNAWTDLLLPANDGRAPEKPLAFVVSAILVATLLALVWRGGSGEWFVFLSTLVPVACAVVLSLTVAPMLIDRYLLFAHVLLLVAVAVVVWRWLPMPGTYETGTGTERPVRSQSQFLWRWLPQPAITGAVVLLLADSLFVHWSYWSELKIAERPGLKTLAEYVRQRRANAEPVIVVHPLVFHAARIYLHETVEPKLFVGEQSLPHYLAQPLLTDGDRISTDELRALPADRLWVVDTTGFNVGYRRVEVAEPWRPVQGSKVAYPEVFCFQGEVTATLYERPGKRMGGATGTKRSVAEDAKE